MSKDDLDLAIAKGKALMKKANDAFHDFDHARSVNQIALEILKAEKIESLRPELITTAAYWHDVYKASKDRFYLSNLDGRGSKFIANKELEGILPKEILDKFLKAINNHDQVVKYALWPKSFSLLDKLLIEADMIDMFNVNRWKRGVCRHKMTYYQRVIFSLFELIAISLVIPRVFTFKTSRQIFERESKKFWDFFLFKEKYLFRVIVNKV